MADESKGRVEMRLRQAGYGTGGTQERIDTLLSQKREHERLTRPEPLQSFAAVLSGDSHPTLPQALHEQSATPKGPQKAPEPRVKNSYPQSPGKHPRIRG